MDSTIQKLAQFFAKFPGIGERQAKRFVYFLLSQSKSDTEELVKLVTELKKKITQCKMCFRFYSDDGHDVCDICGSPNRDASLLMIVEKDFDIDSVERSHSFKGVYFVLGGLIPIVEKETLKRVRINELMDYIDQKKSKLKEIILGFSLSPQGDYTDQYVRELIVKKFGDKTITISSLGRGLSTGTELEYSDSETLKSALQNRK
jgi:recombination protein RecR